MVLPVALLLISGFHSISSLMAKGIQQCALGHGINWFYRGRHHLEITGQIYFEVFPIATPVETEQTFAWVILKHENDSSFREAIQLWLDDFKGSQMRRAFYGYFSGGRIRRDSAFMVTDHISRYDKSIKAEAEKYGWDWRLLASIIYQESHFKPDLESEKGAFGLMQLMPVTMEKYGIDYESSIEGNRNGQYQG